jgi:cell division protein ZapE
MTPLERYQADLKRPEFFHDAAQETAVRHLQRLYDDLIAASKPQAGLGKLFGKKDRRRSRACTSGAASVAQDLSGRHLLRSAAVQGKVRTHFHRFMKRVHEEMKTLAARKTR